MAKEYFRTGINLTKQLNLNSMQENYSDQADFAEKVGLKDNVDKFFL